MTTELPKKRIEVIDALRGFALMGILILHFMEHFELFIYPQEDSAVIGWFDRTLESVIWFLFAGKSYAIFSMLFGLSFFIQMRNQQEKGRDFRPRFLWRLVLLYVFGYVNGLLYLGEIFAVYAVLGMLLVPLYNVSDRWLVPLCVALLCQLPFLSLFVYNLFVSPADAVIPFPGSDQYLTQCYETSNGIYRSGSFGDAVSYNLWSGHMQKWLWFVVYSRLLQIVGLFLLGMLLGRRNVHRDRSRMLRYSLRGLGVGAVLFAVFYSVSAILPLLGLGEANAGLGKVVFKHYVELGVMLMIVGVFVQAYFRLGAKKTLDNLAPVGRMSVTNYMAQSAIGVLLFYGYGIGLAERLGFMWSFLLALSLCALQIVWSKWWIARFYYGPMEWLWRCLTWCSFDIPFRRRSRAVAAVRPE